MGWGASKCQYCGSNAIVQHTIVMSRTHNEESFERKALTGSTAIPEPRASDPDKVEYVLLRCAMHPLDAHIAAREEYEVTTVSLV